MGIFVYCVMAGLSQNEHHKHFPLDDAGRYAGLRTEDWGLSKSRRKRLAISLC